MTLGVRSDTGFKKSERLAQAGVYKSILPYEYNALIHPALEYVVHGNNTFELITEALDLDPLLQCFIGRRLQCVSEHLLDR